MITSRIKTLATRGFTLIELLVVIAIIGILSAVVLASLNTARSKGNDAAVKSNLSTIQTQAALDYDGNGNSYGTQAWTANAGSFTIGSGVPGSSALFVDSTVGNAVAQAIAAAGASTNPISYGASATTFVVVAKLPGAGGYWCVDGNGVAKAESTAPNSTNNYTSGTTFGCI
jgi:prepilin-type N-terminal cleavage/methylation domain-containing protein